VDYEADVGDVDAHAEGVCCGYEVERAGDVGFVGWRGVGRVTFWVGGGLRLGRGCGGACLEELVLDLEALVRF